MTRFRGVKAGMLLGAVAALLGLAAALPAAAHGGKEVVITPTSAAPGESITITGEGLPPNTSVTFTFMGDEHDFATAKTGADGSLSVQAKVPDDLAAGATQVVAQVGSEQMMIPFEIVAAPAMPGMAAGAGAAAMAPAAPAATTMDPGTVVVRGFAATIPSLADAAEALVEGTISALLAILWLLAIALHLARPYMLRTVEKFSLRLGADLWWLIYRGVKDLVAVVVFMLSSIYLLPHVAEMVALPLTGPIAATLLFGALLVKLTRDTDDDYNAFVWESNLIALGAIVYLAGFIFGPGLSALEPSGALAGLSRALTTTTNLDVAFAIVYACLVAVTAMGLYAVAYNLRFASRVRAGEGV